MKKIVLALMSFCLISLCLTQTVFATEKKTVNEDIDEVYAVAYKTAKEGIPELIDSDEGAYAYLVNNIGDVRREDDGTIIIEQLYQGLEKSEEETVRSFVKKINVLIQLDAVSLDSKMQIHFVSDPDDTREPMRRPTASIMGEARNHANELKAVYDNSVFIAGYYTAGMYFAERVRTNGIWDYKSYMGTNTLYYMEDLNTNMTGETIGNFHYGYVGRAVFPAAILRSAAGMYQIYSGTSNVGYWDSFFDDPSDQYDINWGIQMYENEH